MPVRTVIGGDARVRAISAASIIAKVYRDRLLTALHDDGSFMLKKTDGKTMHVMVSAKTAYLHANGKVGQMGALADFLEVDERGWLYVAEESGHLRAYGSAALSLVPLD